jgi:hypothetical protein
MALNFCVICDKPFSETKARPGCVCPDCKEASDEGFKSLKGEDIPDKPNKVYRIR